MASDKGMTHTAIQYRMDKGTTPINTPSETSNDDSIEDTYNELDKVRNIRSLEERVRQQTIKDRVKAHLKEVESESGSEWGSVQSGSAMSEASLLRYFAPAMNQSPKGYEESSSSTSKPVYAMGVNPVVLPKPQAKPKGRPAGSANKPKTKATMERILFGD